MYYYSHISAILIIVFFGIILIFAAPSLSNLLQLKNNLYLIYAMIGIIFFDTMAICKFIRRYNIGRVTSFITSGAIIILISRKKISLKTE